MNIEQAPKRKLRMPTCLNYREGRCCRGRERTNVLRVRRGIDDGTFAWGISRNSGSPLGRSMCRPTACPQGKGRSGADGGGFRTTDTLGSTGLREGNLSWKQCSTEIESARIDSMSLPTSERNSVRTLQRTLHAKAVEEPDFRFYSLYDKIYRPDVLRAAWRRVRKNGGSSGADGVAIEAIEEEGLDQWLEGIAEELREGTYRPAPVRRVWIEKRSGGERPLGIPTVKDRVVQMALTLMLVPIFEADLPDEQYGYRPGRSGKEAVETVHEALYKGHREVVDADLSSYFDTIPHHELLKSVARRVSDGAVLGLIKQWLQMPVEEKRADGHTRRSTESRNSGRGTPQGAPISPLLANLYMRRFVVAWKQLGFEDRFGAKLVIYADDLVILCRRSAPKARKAMEAVMRKLRLTVNETKTCTCRAPEEPFVFLGYQFGRCYNPKTGKSYIGTRPAEERVQALCREISSLTAPRTQTWPVETIVHAINRKVEGWANYFCLGPVRKTYKAIDRHVRRRVRRWLCRKHGQNGRGRSCYPSDFLHKDLGVKRIVLREKPWQHA